MTKRLEIRIEENDYTKIKERAKNLNMSVSEFIRQSALKGWILEFKNAEIRETIRHISKIGDNINQIARHANSTGEIANAEIKKCQEDINEALDYVGDFFFNPITQKVLDLIK